MITCTLPGRHFASGLPEEDKQLPDDHVCPATPESEPWDGYGTAAKPAHEPIVVARKPLAGTVAGNVLEHGTGAINVDGCRVGTVVETWPSSRGPNTGTAMAGGVMARRETGEPPAGRWPPNILLTHSPDCNGDCAPGCPVAELDSQSGKAGAAAPVRGHEPSALVDAVYGQRARVPGAFHADEGGASRFFPCFRYQAKAPSSERPRLPDRTAWPTVKPVALMRWLVRLVTPPGGTVLDPFAGTGTTGEACALEGFDCILIERDPVALALARQRLAKPSQGALL